MGIRTVARDEFGKVVAATAKVFPYIGDLLMAKAMGAWYVVQLGRGMGWFHVILEGDSLGVVSALQKVKPCWSSVGQLIEDTWSSLQHFHSFFIKHVKRDGNQVANRLAKLVISQLLDTSWIKCSSFI